MFVLISIVVFWGVLGLLSKSRQSVNRPASIQVSFTDKLSELTNHTEIKQRYQDQVKQMSPQELDRIRHEFTKVMARGGLAQ